MAKLENREISNSRGITIQDRPGDIKRIALDNPSTNNPQLLKFDGESAPPPVEMVKAKLMQRGQLKKTVTVQPMRERNKSLKRKQIE